MFVVTHMYLTDMIGDEFWGRFEDVFPLERVISRSVPAIGATTSEATTSQTGGVPGGEDGGTADPEDPSAETSTAS